MGVGNMIESRELRKEDSLDHDPIDTGLQEVP